MRFVLVLRLLRGAPLLIIWSGSRIGGRKTKEFRSKTNADESRQVLTLALGPSFRRLYEHMGDRGS